MRELKFRAKTFGGKLIYFDLRECYAGGQEVLDTIDYETLSQFTGLEDREGNKIYEGDILQIFTPKGVEAYTEVVDDIFKAHNLSGVGDYFGSCEVIGNIYEK